MKFVLFDADGVILRKAGYFSERYSKKFGVPNDKIIPFFKSQFRLCQIGKGDLKEALPKYLPQWQWQGTVDEFLQYWFSDDVNVNLEVLESVRELRKQGIKCYLATDQEKYRAHYLWEKKKLSEEFDGAFFSCDLGYLKIHSEFWKNVLEKLDSPDPNEVVFWDDEDENVEAATKAGIDARLFTGELEI